MSFSTRRHGTFYVRIAEYRDREARAETDALLGSRTISMVPRLIPRTFRGLEDDLRWRSPERDSGHGFAVAVGESSTAVRHLEVRGFENEREPFVRAAFSYSIGGSRLRAFERMRELARRR